MYRPLEGDCELELFSFDSDEGRDAFWHSSAHILGQVLEMKYGCKLCIGPCSRRGDLQGFYYDAFYGDLALNEAHFESIESGFKQAVKESQPFERIEVTREQALEMFSDNTFKVEIINDLPVDKAITVYRCGDLVDLCRGPHIPNTSFVKAFASYWRGNKDRDSLQRVYGISYPDKKQLNEYNEMRREAEKYDHRVLGKKQELFFTHHYSPGSWFFKPHGYEIYEKLMKFIKVQYRDRGYKVISSPDMYNMELWKTSGHAANYMENMYSFNNGGQEFAMKPMNCPGHCLMFEQLVHSYNELPLRLADFGVLHRKEASGALSGLTRVTKFQQVYIGLLSLILIDDDYEVRGVLEFIEYAYNVFGLNYELKLSTRPEKYVGKLETWEKAEAALKDALNEFGKPWQLDFQLPLRFKLEYLAEGGKRKETPVMIHGSVLGSFERMIAILLEHYKGKWPFWLSPRQAIVIPVSEKSMSYARQVMDQIDRARYCVDVDLSDRKIQKKVFEAQLAQYNFILVVGEEEAKTGQVSVRQRDKADKDRLVMTMETLLQHFKKAKRGFCDPVFRLSNHSVYKNMSNWSDLPIETLNLIVEHLYYIDQIRVRAVCKSWRSNIYNNGKYADKLPWILAGYKSSINIIRSNPIYLYEPSQQRRYKVETKIPSNFALIHA
ncbi:hypothetical protein Dsin_023961 [Dipteronia sinensis]|uniref:threonine--tRNA ligase n=1 Tax=Dipteronia sinensis TaxID=43782 RepID=A0AAE0E1E7_9ROSI|nr:hypothetical protein Dsin_023961 [Dipteronia sinensis]